MEALAKSKHIKQSVKKIRFIIELIKDLSAENAIRKLEFTNKKSANHINKTIKAAVSNLLQKDAQINKDNISIYLLRFCRMFHAIYLLRHMMSMNRYNI